MLNKKLGRKDLYWQTVLRIFANQINITIIGEH